jgi:hypothetical protein
VCFELGRLPHEIEKLDAGEFLELVTFVRMRDEAEKKSMEESKAKSKGGRRR